MSNEGFQITGRVDEVTPATTDRGYTERTIVVTVDGRYPQTYPVRFSDKTGGAAAKLDGIRKGDEVTIGFDIRSRKPNDRWFTNLDGWKVTRERSASRQDREQPRDTRRDDRSAPPRDDRPPYDDDDLPPDMR